MPSKDDGREEEEEEEEEQEAIFVNAHVPHEKNTTTDDVMGCSSSKQKEEEELIKIERNHDNNTQQHVPTTTIITRTRTTTQSQTSQDQEQEQDPRITRKCIIVHSSDDDDDLNSNNNNNRTKSNKKTINNRYREVCKLGEGSFAKVRKYYVLGNDDDDDVVNNNTVSENNIKNVVAIKIYNKQRLGKMRINNNERTALDDAYDEAMILLKLKHENITRLIEFICADESPKLYLVIEFCAGGPILNDDDETFEKIDIRTCMKYARDVFSAVHYIHDEACVAHLDIKPQNMLIDSFERIKLADFGTAVVMIKEESNSSSNDLNNYVTKTPGTPAFTAPECCEGAAYDGFKADCWAVGVSFLAMLQGYYYYQSMSSFDTYRKILEEDAPKIIRTVDSSISSSSSSSSSSRTIASKCPVDYPTRQEVQRTAIAQHSDANTTEEGENFLLTIDSLLMKDPAMRVSIQEALERLNFLT